MDRKRDGGRRVDLLLTKYDIPYTLWNPCKGDMSLSNRLISFGRVVLSTEYPQVDFFSKGMPMGFGNIICVPPKNALEYVLHAINILPNGGSAIFFLPMTFLESQERYKKLFRYYPPMYVFQFSERMGDETRGSYAWMVWKKGVKTKTILEWL